MLWRNTERKRDGVSEETWVQPNIPAPTKEQNRIHNIDELNRVGGGRVGGLHRACCLRSRRARVRLPALRAANEARPRSARLVSSHKFRGWRHTFIAPLALRSLAGGGGAALSLRARRFACALSGVSAAAGLQ